MRERARKEEQFVRSFDVQPGGRLKVKLDFGSIRVQGGESDRIEIAVSRSVEAEEAAEADELLKNFRFEFHQSGNDLKVRVKGPARGGFFKSLRRSHERLDLALVISCPRRFDVDLETRAGALFLDGLLGEVRCSSVAGSVTIGDIQGAVYADTYGGPISTGRIEGRVVAKTLAGGIRVREVTDGIDASSRSGGVVAYLSGQPRTDSRLSSLSGDVVVRLAEGVGVDIDAESLSGRIVTEFPLDADQRSYSVRDKIQGGGPRLLLRVSAGNIHVKRKEMAASA
jgi:hypothetical protein